MRHAAVLLLALLLTTAAHAAPKDWSDNEWYQYFEAAVTTLVGEAPGHYAKMAGTVAVTPVTDVYAALSGAGSAVKPGLLIWLQRKMEEAHDVGDLDRADRYQAFHTALATGDDARLRGLLEEARQRAKEAEAASDPPASFPKVGQLSQHPFNGRWKTTWGTMDLRISDDGSANGTYSYKSTKGVAVRGTLKGRVVGDYTLEVTRWTESVPGEFAAGTGTMTITADGKSFMGDYVTTEGETGNGEWSGERIK